MRKILAALTAYLMLNVVLACVAGAADFGDVPPDYWAREEIQYVTDRGLFLGKTPETFEPENGMTQGQMAAVLYRLAGLPETDAAMPYTDVPSGAYYYDAVRWAAKSGIFTQEKLSTNTLRPDETITRGEFAVMLRNYDHAHGGAEPARTEHGFTDMADASPEVRSAVLNWAFPKGILRGTTPTTMNPNGRLTRAHVAAMLTRYDRMVNGANSLPFMVSPPHTAEEVASGRLEPNETYTLLVGDAYADGNYAITSGNPETVTVTYSDHAWQLHTKSTGTAFLTITDKRTGDEQTLYVKVGIPGEKVQEDEEKENNPDEYREERLDIVRRANEVRVRNGEKECAVSEALMEAAQKFAETHPTDHDIALEHRLRAESGCTHGVGCNIYRAANIRLSAMPLAAVYAWEHSRGHYLAMVNGSCDSMGIGLTRDGDTWYCVMFIGDCQKTGSILGNTHP